MGMIAAGFAAAQEYSRFTFDASAGFTESVGNTGRYLDNGWNAGFGAGVNLSSRLALMAQYQYTDMSMNSATFRTFGAAGGDGSVWSLTLDPRFHVWPKGPVDFYVVGGGGVYTRRNAFDPPFTAMATPGSPFFGFVPVASSTPTIPVMLPSSSLSKPGFNVGAGVQFGKLWHAKFFAEARWHHMFLGDLHEDYIPVSFGITF